MPNRRHKTVCMTTAVVEVPNSSGIGSGGSTHAIEVLKGFRRKQFSTTLFCARGNGQSESEDIEGAQIVRMFCWKNVQGSWPKEPSGKSSRILAFLIEPLKVAYRTLRSVIHSLQILVRLRGKHIDIVYERTSGSTLAGTFVAFAKQVPLICEVNDLTYSQFSLRIAQYIITPNADVLPATFRERCITMPWGVDIHHFTPRQVNEQLQFQLGLKDKRVILFTGSCLPWHGLLDIVEVSQLICSSQPDVCFLVVGDGPTRALAELRVREKRLTENFCFTGFIPYEQLPYYMSLAEMAVAPYTSHLSGDRAKIASPLKVLEYMAMGLPTVVSESGNHQDFIVPGVNGYVFSTGNVAEMCAALLRLLNNQTRIVEMGWNAREQCVAKYSWEAHCDAISKLVELLD